jgi:hypothetical protein
MWLIRHHHMKRYGRNEDSSAYSLTLCYTEVRYVLPLLHLRNIPSNTRFTESSGFHAIPGSGRVLW